jgi:hypothetical protein
MSGDLRRRKPPASIVMPTPPDLQALVRQYGGYHRIPNDAWAKHYDQMIQVWTWLAMRHFHKHTARKHTKRKINSSNNDAADDQAHDRRSGSIVC